MDIDGPPVLQSAMADDLAAAGCPGRIRRPSFSPLYQQIKALLVDAACRPASGSPGEADSQRDRTGGALRVSQGTVRKAIDEMAAENLLVRRQGKGTFVATHAEAQTQYRFLRLTPDDGAPARCSGGCSTAGACARRPTWRGAGAEGRRGRGAGAAPAAGRGEPRRWCWTTSGCPARCSRA